MSSLITNMKFLGCELIYHVSKFCVNEWQDIWNCFENNKLWSVYLTVGSITHSKNTSRHDCVVINRLQIGHSRLAHSYLLSNDDVPLCETCGLPLTVKHVLF